MRITNLLESRLLLVSLLVEVGEEEVEHDGVHSNPPDKSAGVVAVGEKQLEGVQHNHHELNLKRDLRKEDQKFVSLNILHFFNGWICQGARLCNPLRARGETAA